MCYFEILFIIIKSEALETWVSWGYYNSNSHCQSFDCKNPKLFRYPKCCLSKKYFWKNEIEEMSSHDWQTYYAGEGTWKEVELVNHYKIMSIDEKYNISHSMIAYLEDQTPIAELPTNCLSVFGHFCGIGT